MSDHQRDERTYWLDEPRNANRLYWLLVGVCAILFAADFLIHRHVHFGWESFPGLYAIVGFVAFWCIVIVGKHLRKILWRPEDYYDD